MNWHPLKAPVLDIQFVHLANRLVTRQPFNLGENSCEIIFFPFDDPNMHSSGVIFSVTINTVQTHLCIETSFLEQLADNIMENWREAEFPIEWTWIHVFSLLLAEVEVHDLPIEVKIVDGDVLNKLEGGRLVGSLSRQGLNTSFIWFVPATNVEKIASSLDEFPRKIASISVEALGSPTWLVIGHFQLSIRELRALDVGDFLRVGTSSTFLQQQILAVKGVGKLTGCFEGDEYHVQSIEYCTTSEGPAMIPDEPNDLPSVEQQDDGANTLVHEDGSNSSPDQAEENAIDRQGDAVRQFLIEQREIKDIPIRLELRIGHTHLTIGELSNLCVGTILRPGINIDQPVEILANGLQIGDGLLYQLGDEVGVRVTSLIGKIGIKPDVE